MLSLKRSTVVDFEVPLRIEPNNMTGYDVFFWNQYLLGVKKVQATPISQQSMSVPFRGSCQTFRRALYGGPSQAVNAWDIAQKAIIARITQLSVVLAFALMGIPSDTYTLKRS